MKIIGEVTGETGDAGPVAALRFRLDELGVTRETVDVADWVASLAQ
jgi:hypothetical protein